MRAVIAVVGLLSLAPIGEARADALEVPELAAPPDARRWWIAVDDARVIGEDDLDASSQALRAGVAGHDGPWTIALELGAIAYHDARAQLDGRIVSERDVSAAGATVDGARWSGGGPARVYLRGALAVPFDGDEGDLPPSMQLRVTANPWARRGVPSLKLAAGVRYDDQAVALQAEAGGDLGVSSGEHATWAHGLVWLGGGAAFAPRRGVAITLHALARWLPKASPWKRADEGAVAGAGVSVARGRGRIGVRAEVRIDGGQLTDDGLDPRDALVTRVIVGYGARW